MNKKILSTIAIFLIVASLPITASADNFDGSRPLTCAAIFSASCQAADQKCTTGAPWMINFPVFMEVDFKAKTVSTTELHENPRITKIMQVSKLNDGHTAIQGIDDDYVYSMLIAEETGSMTLSIAGEDSGFLVFGACHPE